MNDNFQEKRQSKRFLNDAKVTVTANGKNLQGQCINESQTGVLITLSSAIDVDSQVLIQQEDQSTQHPGQVVRLIEDEQTFLIAVKY